MQALEQTQKLQQVHCDATQTRPQRSEEHNSGAGAGHGGRQLQRPVHGDHGDAAAAHSAEDERGHVDLSFEANLFVLLFIKLENGH